MAKQELVTLLTQFRALRQEIKWLMLQIENLIEGVPGVQAMMTIPGVGLVTVAGFLAEVGNLENYHHPRQIQKLAGLNLRENSSGKHKGKPGSPKEVAHAYEHCSTNASCHWWLITRNSRLCITTTQHGK